MLSVSHNRQYELPTKCVQLFEFTVKTLMANNVIM